MAHDFRFEKDALAGLSFSVCGLGNSLYTEHFNTVAIELDRSFSSLHANRISPLYCCDENTVKSKHSSLEGDVEFWQNNFFEKLGFYLKTKNSSILRKQVNHLNFLLFNYQKCLFLFLKKSEEPSCCQSNEKTQASCCQTESLSSCCNKKTNISDDSGEAGEDIEENEIDSEYTDSEDQEFSDLDEDFEEEEEEDKDLGAVKKEKSNGLVDLEDLGKVVTKQKRSKERAAKDTEPKEMITPLLRKSLTKQGYKLIGSHSGVKLCRWTKSMLRGRGGCYKHTFYGIESHRCMETTPSLACANKCVFCWRHHSNPVGTEWKWKMDGAEMIFEEALSKHVRMVNEYKGIYHLL